MHVVMKFDGLGSIIELIGAFGVSRFSIVKVQLPQNRPRRVLTMFGSLASLAENQFRLHTVTAGKSRLRLGSLVIVVADGLLMSFETVLRRR